MNYGEMSADELLNEIDLDVVEGYPRDKEKVAALRKAVIREASVGTLRIKHDDTLHDTLERCRLTWIAEVKRGKWEDYDIIPHKETP